MFDLCGVAIFWTDVPQDCGRGNLGAAGNITHRGPLYYNVVGGTSASRDKLQQRLLSGTMLEP